MNHEKELEVAKKAAKAAAEITRECQKQEIKVEEKADGSPLTDADMKSHDKIIKMLYEAFPKDAIISEEGEEGADRETAERTWIVDPLDGTQEFINQTDEYTINIALIVKNRPVVAVMAVPGRNQLYWAVDDEGSWLEENQETIEISVSGTSRMSQAKAVKSKNYSKPQLATMLENLGVEEQIPIGSSLKGCMVAEGEADIYLRLQSYHDWDVAAMDLIITEAGGVMCGLDGEELLYNVQSLFKEGLIACTPLLLDRILEETEQY